MKTEQEILRYYEMAEAIWFFDYSGDPKAPHVELTSGFCSDGYVNSAPVLALPEVVELLANELVLRLGEHGIMADWVIGSAYSAITFSYEVARQIGARHGFVEKHPTNPKRMVWGRLTISEGASILQCEELITTLGTVREVRRAVQAGNKSPVNFLPEIATAVFRPEKLPDISNIISLITRVVMVWNQEYCPLCAQGSPRLRPRQTQENWVRLTGKG